MKTIRKPSNDAIYKQFDSRWGNLPYPVLPSTMASSGCGCCAVTHCAIERAKYATYTPKDVQPFMKQYAERGHGTYWVGITKGLEHYGLKGVKQFYTESGFLKEMEKGNRVGVLLFGNTKAKDGTLWTSVGHYVAILGMRKSDDGKQTYLYCKDSGGRNHDGWFNFASSIKGCVKQGWVAEVPQDDIVLPSRGYFQYGDEGDSVKVIQRFLKKQGLYKGKIGGHYRRLTRKAVRKFQEKYAKKYGLTVDGLWGKQCNALYEMLK